MRGLIKIASVAVLVALFDPAAAQQGLSATPNKDISAYSALAFFGDVFDRVRTNYVDKVDDDKLIGAALEGMLASLDPHSSYMNEKDFKEMQAETSGEFAGLGLEVTLENGRISVVSPIDSTPAAAAGIRTGDLIAAIDGEATQNLTLTQAVDKMRGPAESSVRLTIERAGVKPFDVTLKRSIVRVPSVHSQLEAGMVGYIRISSFSEQTQRGLDEAVGTLKKAAAGNLTGVVLDLRNNPGGLLDQAVAVCDDFIKAGEIVSTRGRQSDEGSRYDAKGHDILDGLPLVVLINGGSASASEIVAGALQDHHRAMLMGTRSFGKGSVQTIIPIEGAGAIRLTTARYYTPSGRSIQAKGIEPDIVVEAAKITTVAEGKLAHEADLRGVLKNTDRAAPAKAPPATSASPTSDGSGGENDYQLQRAVDFITGVARFNRARAEAN